MSPARNIDLRRKDEELNRRVMIGLLAVGALVVLLIAAGIIAELVIKPAAGRDRQREQDRPARLPEACQVRLVPGRSGDRSAGHQPDRRSISWWMSNCSASRRSSAASPSPRTRSPRRSRNRSATIACRRPRRPRADAPTATPDPTPRRARPDRRLPSADRHAGHAGSLSRSSYKDYLGSGEHGHRA